MKASELIDGIRASMAAAMATKTGWGRNEVMMALEASFSRALASATELREEAQSPPPNFVPPPKTSEERERLVAAFRELLNHGSGRPPTSG